MANELTTLEGNRLIDQIAIAGRPVLVLSGGEPLMRTDIFDLAGHAKGRGLPVALASNGTMIDQVLAGRIADTGFDRVSISLDGASSTTHDRFRGQDGAFEKSIQALRHLHTAGVPTQLNCTIARHNQHELAEVLELGRKMGVAAVHFFLLVPVGCGEQIAEDQMLSSGEVENRLREIAAFEQSTDLQIKATCAPHYYRVVRQQAKIRRQSEIAYSHAARSGGPGPTGHYGPLHSATKGCLAGTAVCFISHDGKVFPCGYLPVEAGNVRRQSFAEIWRNNHVFNALRDPDQLAGKCGVCEFKSVCAGCRARAFYQYGDYLAEEPFCEYQPAGQ